MIFLGVNGVSFPVYVQPFWILATYGQHIGLKFFWLASIYHGLVFSDVFFLATRNARTNTYSYLSFLVYATCYQ